MTSCFAVPRVHFALTFVVWASAFLSTAAAAITSTRLHAELGANRSVYDVYISPDQNRVVFTVAQVTDLGPNGTKIDVDSLFSARLSDGATVRLDDTAHGPTIISSFGFDRPLLSADGQSMVFISNLKSSNVSTIYRAAIDGSDTSPVTTISDAHLAPFAWISLTPDDERVVYKRSINGDVMSVPIGGGPTTVLNPPLGATGFTHNLYHVPDASRVMFVLGDDADDNNRELYSVGPDGGSPAILSTTATNGDNEPVLLNSIVVHNSSTHVLYRTGDYFSHPRSNLFSVPIAGGTPVQLNPTSNSHFPLNAWMTPDGARVVFDRWSVSGGPADFFTVPVTGGAALQLNATLALNESLDSPVFTTDSKSALLIVNGPLPRLEVVSLETGQRRQLNAPTAVGGFLRHARLSPDGSTVAYIEDHDADGINDLFLVPFLGGTPVQVNDPLPSFADVNRVDFSPDGRSLVYHADTMIDDIRRAFVAQIDGSLPGFGLDQFHPLDVTLDTTEDTFVTLLSHNRALMQIGDFSSHELYLLQIPEPSCLSLAAVPLCALASSRRRRRDHRQGASEPREGTSATATNR